MAALLRTLDEAHDAGHTFDPKATITQVDPLIMSAVNDYFSRPHRRPGDPRMARRARRGAGVASRSPGASSAYHAPRRFSVTVAFIVKLEDRPGSLARVAQALADKGVNITAIVGIAEDADSQLMLNTSDPAATREALGGLGIAFEESDPTGGLEPSAVSLSDLFTGRSG